MSRRLTGFYVLTSLAILATASKFALADPLPDEVLKFQQLPLNNGFVPVRRSRSCSTGGTVSRPR